MIRIKGRFEVQDALDVTFYFLPTQREGCIDTINNPNVLHLLGAEKTGFVQGNIFSSFHYAMK